MAIFHLIRHGYHDWLPRGWPGRNPGVFLTDLGQAQAEHTADWLMKRKIRAIIASPLERAQQTAAAFARKSGLPIQTEMDFNELNFGQWSGMTFAELHEQPGWARWDSIRSLARPPGGETMVDVQTRVISLLLREYEQFPGDEVAMFGHGDPIKVAVAYCMGMPVDNVPRFNVDPASISTVEILPKGIKVHWVNRSAQPDGS